MSLVQSLATLCLVLAANLILPSPARSGTGPPPLNAGTRVRVFAPSVRTEPFVGTLTVCAGDTLTLSEVASATAIPMNRIARIDTILPARKPSGSLGLAGLLVGGAAGAAVAALGADDETAASRIVGTALITGAVGLGVGTYLEHGRSRERWVDAWYPVPAASYEIAESASSTGTDNQGEFFVPARSVLARVAVAGTPPDTLVGRLRGARGDALTLEVRSRELNTQWRDIERIDVLLSSRRSTGRGALTGMAVGAALGAVGLLIAAAGEESGGGTPDIDPAAVAAVGAGLYVVLGAGVGALIGHGSVHETWGALPGGHVGVDPQGDVWIPAPSDLPIRVTSPLRGEGVWHGHAAAREGDSLSFVHDGRRIRVSQWHVSKLEVGGSGEWEEIPIQAPPLDLRDVPEQKDLSASREATPPQPGPARGE